jgi:hypothetical protein
MRPARPRRPAHWDCNFNVQHDAVGVGTDRWPVDGGTEGARGVAADAAGENDLHVSRAADIEVVTDQGLEEEPGAAGRVEDESAGDLDLPHGSLPPVPGQLVLAAERHREPGQPPLGEHLDSARLQPVAHRLQPVRVIAGGEPVGQRGEPDPGLERLPLGPLVPVDQILAG